MKSLNTVTGHGLMEVQYSSEQELSQEQAIELLKEALSRIENPSPNANGGSTQIGGAYWRIAQVLERYLFPQLSIQEGPKQTAKLVREHGLIARPAQITAAERPRP